MVKKRLLFLFFVKLIVVLLVACGGAPAAEPTARELTIATPRGPAALGMLYLMEQSQNDATIGSYTFHVVGSPDEIPPMLVRGDIDIAAVPPNLASILNNNPNLDLQVLAVPTMGVLHIVDTTGTISSIEDLRGRTIYSSGGGGMPEFILNYVLLGNSLIPGVDVEIVFRPEHTEIAALLESGMAEIAMLPEPFATTTVNRVDNLEYALDVTAEWDRISPEAGLVMTAVIARREVIENYPDAIQTFMQEYELSIRFTRQNVEEAAELAVAHDIIPAAPVARAAIPRSNIVFITGEQMKRYLEGVLRVFYNQSPESVGGQMPDADFYFGG